MTSKFIQQTDEKIKQEMLDNIEPSTNVQAGTFINESLAPISISMAELYIDLESINKKRYIENLDGDDLDSYINDRTGEVKRREATYAKGTLSVEGELGAIVPKETIVSNNITQYKTLEQITIPESGIGNVEIQCLEKGPIGNTPKMTIATLDNEIPGINNIYNKEEISNGYEEEDDNTLRDRYLKYIREPAISGNVFHYIHWATSVPGVGDAKVVPLWKGDNTVKVIIVDYNYGPANTDLVNKTQEYIDPESKGEGRGTAPIGAYCTVVSAEPREIKISINISKELGYEQEDIKTNIIENLKKYLQEISFKSNIISYAKIGANILSAKGVKDYKDLKINGETKNINLDDEEVPVLKEVIINGV